MSLLYERITREHDNRKYKRKPAKGSLIIKLEELVNITQNIVGFDGYIIPKNSIDVTLLLYCREYNEQDVIGYKTSDLAAALFDALEKEINFEIAKQFAEKLECGIACVFTPYDYPNGDFEIDQKKIVLFPEINKRRTVKKQNIKQFREFLKYHKKRYSKKPVTFIPTKLEYFLANNPENEWKIALPGDADGIFMDEDYNVQAILEYKSDTKGKILDEESIEKYEIDSTRFNVLDDFCKKLEVPLIVIFWSDTHCNAKITIRNANKGAERSLPILKSDNYDSSSEKIHKVLVNLDLHMRELNLL